MEEQAAWLVSLQYQIKKGGREKLWQVGLAISCFWEAVEALQGSTVAYVVLGRGRADCEMKLELSAVADV